MIEIKLIHEHNVAIDLLPENAEILDLGCRGFDFTNYFRQRGHIVHAVDCDNLNWSENTYDRFAISNYNGTAKVIQTADPQGTHIDFGNDVECLTLESYSKFVGVLFWDLIKIDIEGSEKQVIHHMFKPMAKQISIEFHMHLPNYQKNDVENMVKHLINLGYEIATHELTNQHCAGFNYWSSLFILRDQ